ncbi:uncharacterized protein LOC109728998 [Ananas comosus]|uniref:Uncharacterized protein LOC109728998 n=1 Tax=Ananas comosus TaxID=4615 RepID=A0A6P5HMI7_ANACO|nr:uncharacterized protein LOC109728998 [Ananas comosus]
MPPINPSLHRRWFPPFAVHVCILLIWVLNAPPDPPLLRRSLALSGLGIIPISTVPSLSRRPAVISGWCAAVSRRPPLALFASLLVCSNAGMGVIDVSFKNLLLEITQRLSIPVPKYGLTVDSSGQLTGYVDVCDCLA